MKKTILVTGRENSGKSNTIALLYESLVKFQSNHIFNGRNVEGRQITFPIAKGEDFSAVFTLKDNLKIGLISCGDSLSMFESDFDSIKNDTDILICVSRTSIQRNSVYKYVIEEMPNMGFQLQLNLCTFASSDKSEMQRNIVNVILNFLNL